MKGEVDHVGVLDALQHGLRLPPGLIPGVVEVRQVVGGVIASSADTASFVYFSTRLDAVRSLRRFTTRVRHFHFETVRRVTEFRDASLRTNKYKLSFEVVSKKTHCR